MRGRAGEQGLARTTGQARQTLAGPDQTAWWLVRELPRRQESDETLTLTLES